MTIRSSLVGVVLKQRPFVGFAGKMDQKGLYGSSQIDAYRLFMYKLCT